MATALKNLKHIGHQGILKLRNCRRSERSEF